VASKTFNKDMLQEDMEVGIRGLYQDNGYFEMSFGGSGEATLTPVEINKQGLVKGRCRLSDRNTARRPILRSVSKKALSTGWVSCISSTPIRKRG